MLGSDRGGVSTSIGGEVCLNLKLADQLGDLILRHRDHSGDRVGDDVGVEGGIPRSGCANDQ